MKKETQIKILIIGIPVIILGILLFLVFNNMNFNKLFKENIKKGDNGVVVNKKEINLSDYKDNINIHEGGEYNIKGSFNYSLIIDSKEKVTLNLNNVTINSKNASAIANINTGELVINLPNNTINILKDNGSSEYDGCIYSSSNLIIRGSGTLKVYAKQKNGEGIATTDADITINGGNIYIESKDDGLNTGGDRGGIITITEGDIYIKAKGDGIDSNNSIYINGGNLYIIGSSKGGDAGIDANEIFEINAGNVIALGSDMLQKPDKSSKQNYVSFNLKAKINSNSKISLMNEENKEVVSFIADEDFKTLIISNSLLTKGTYTMYVNGTKTNHIGTIE